jgi:hypothetical protein
MNEQLKLAKSRFVELCVKMGKNQGNSKLVESVLTIGVKDPDFAGPFEGSDGGRFITVMGYSVGVKRLVAGANAYSIGVWELLNESKFQNKTYEAGYQSLKAVGIVSEE